MAEQAEREARQGRDGGLGSKVEDILAKLTLEQKCALLTGATAFGTRAYPASGLPAIEFSDGPHGLRHQSDDANHLGIGGSDPATCFPTAVTLADTWDEGLVGRVGAALGEEAATEGVNVLLGPGVCLKRSPLCGRDFEYFSEDPYLAGKMAASYVRGVQSQGVGACPKHFAANSQETRRQASDSVLDERTLRELYLTAFEIVVREAHPKCLMTSYNLVNGTYANENARLLRDILRGEWGYEGAVVTDWGGSNDHVAGVRAGSTFEMPSCGLDSARELLAAVRSGRLSEDDIDARAREAIALALSTHDAVADAPRSFDIEAHHELAREAAAAGIVLLKNEAVPAPAAGAAPAAEGAPAAPLLPLAPGTRVALVGDFAEDPRYQGAGSSLVNCTKLDTLLGCIGGYDLEFAGYEPGFDRKGADADEGKAAAAVALARKADVVIACLGLSEAAESEGLDRSTLALDPRQTGLLARLHEANPRVVVLLSAGSVVETDWAKDAPAILYLGLGGQAGAHAALDALTGAVNPSGKLAETWPRRLADTPCAGSFPSDGPEAEYREGIYVGYRYYQKAGVPVAYPFGFGLSYTTFSYSDLRVASDGSSATFTLANTGDRAGAEVCELYVSKPGSAIFRPERELKGFAKVALAPGESRQVTIALDDKAYRYFNVRTGAWEVEGGTYAISVGGSSDDLPLSATVEIAGTGAPDPYEGKRELLADYYSGHVQQVPDDEFAALLGRPVPRETIHIDQNMCLRDAGHSRSPAFWLVGAYLRSQVKKVDGSGRPNLDALFVYNMPLRALAKNGMGYVSMGLVRSLVREAKGWGLAGAVPSLAVSLAARKAWLFPIVWFLWFAAPPAASFAANQARNASYEKLLARQDAEQAASEQTTSAQPARPAPSGR